MTKLTKRDKMRWKATIKKWLFNYLDIHGADILWTIRQDYPVDSVKYGQLLIRQFKAAIRKVR